MYLRLDLGTSARKALLAAPDHRVLARAEHRLRLSTPRPGWSEQDPADWPAILWNNMRSTAECAALDEACPDFPALTGNGAMPGFTAPKRLWMARHQPDLFARPALVLPHKDLRLRLTGMAIGEMSDASSTFRLEVARRDWSDELLAAPGMCRAHVPALAEGSDVARRLRPGLAARLASLADGGAEERVCRPPAIRQVCLPQAGLDTARYRRFRDGCAASPL